MYEAFFGFKEKPFNITPDPRFLYLSKKHREALAHLIYGVKQRKGFVVLSGEVGTGKTTLVRALLERLDKSFQIAYVLNPTLSVTEFFKFVSHDFGLHVNGASKVDYLIKLHDFLLQSQLDDKTTTLIVDEAQYLEPPLFNEIRMLTNLETSRQKLLQVLLVGQPELNDYLERPDFRHLKQRISIRYHLLPLDRQETVGYIQTRMRIAGAKRQNCFTQGALLQIYEYSGGVPRLINNICDNSLLTAFATDKPIVNEQIVRECADDLRLEKVRKRAKRERRREESAPRRHVSVATVLLIVLIGLVAAGIVMFFSGKMTVPQVTWRSLETIRSLFHKEQEPEVLGTGVIQREETDQKEETTEPQFESEDSFPVEAPLVETAPVTDSLEGESKGSRNPDSGDTPGVAENPGSQVVTAKLGENVSQIIFREFGRLDTHLLEAVRKLNPEIEDINKIEAGQTIRLPSDSVEAYKNPGTPSYFSIHIGSFKRMDQANNLFEHLIQIGEKPTIIPAQINGTNWYRVAAGEYEDLTDAFSHGKKLVQSSLFGYSKPIKILDL
jgi:general secretion pathway protein A